ncbi:Histone-lysine N-methyltransferase set9 [Entomortierella beljakovae]|nr:Histone-lysine N-methyltransferase set9 [Entomortierella beljakovae]
MDLQTLSTLDDLVSDILLDGINLWFQTHKMNKDYNPIQLPEGKVLDIIQRRVIVDRKVPEAVKALLEHARRYLNIYLPTAGFEISQTDRYSAVTNKSEACVIANRRFEIGFELRYCAGTIAILNEQEERDLENRTSDFSVIKTSRKGTCLFLGPARFVNHDCDPNCSFMSAGANVIYFKVLKSINVNDEITTHYGDNYFGPNNQECLCATCERLGRGGYRKSRGAASETPLSPSMKPVQEGRRLRMRQSINYYPTLITRMPSKQIPTQVQTPPKTTSPPVESDTIPNISGPLTPISQEDQDIGEEPKQRQNSSELDQSIRTVKEGPNAEVLEQTIEDVETFGQISEYLDQTEQSQGSTLNLLESTQNYTPEDTSSIDDDDIELILSASMAFLRVHDDTIDSEHRQSVHKHPATANESPIECGNEIEHRITHDETEMAPFVSKNFRMSIDFLCHHSARQPASTSSPVSEFNYEETMSDICDHESDETPEDHAPRDQCEASPKEIVNLPPRCESCKDLIPKHVTSPTSHCRRCSRHLSIYGVQWPSRSNQAIVARLRKAERETKAAQNAQINVTKKSSKKTRAEVHHDWMMQHNPMCDFGNIIKEDHPFYHTPYPVFIDPQASGFANYWKIAVTVPLSEMDTSMPDIKGQDGNSVEANTIVVQCLESLQYIVCNISSLKLLHPCHEPYCRFDKSYGQRFTEHMIVKKALSFLRQEIPDRSSWDSMAGINPHRYVDVDVDIDVVISIQRNIENEYIQVEQRRSSHSEYRELYRRHLEQVYDDPRNLEMLHEQGDYIFQQTQQLIFQKLYYQLDDQTYLEYQQPFGVERRSKLTPSKKGKPSTERKRKGPTKGVTFKDNKVSSLPVNPDNVVQNVGAAAQYPSKRRGARGPGKKTLEKEAARLRALEESGADMDGLQEGAQRQGKKKSKAKGASQVSLPTHLDESSADIDSLIRPEAARKSTKKSPKKNQAISGPYLSTISCATEELSQIKKSTKISSVVWWKTSSGFPRIVFKPKSDFQNEDPQLFSTIPEVTPSRFMSLSSLLVLKKASEAPIENDSHMEDEYRLLERKILEGIDGDICSFKNIIRFSSAGSPEMSESSSTSTLSTPCSTTCSEEPNSEALGFDDFNNPEDTDPTIKRRILDPRPPKKKTKKRPAPSSITETFDPSVLQLDKDQRSDKKHKITKNKVQDSSTNPPTYSAPTISTVTASSKPSNINNRSSAPPRTEAEKLQVWTIKDSLPSEGAGVLRSRPIATKSPVPVQRSQQTALAKKTIKTELEKLQQWTIIQDIVPDIGEDDPEPDIRATRSGIKRLRVPKEDINPATLEGSPASKRIKFDDSSLKKTSQPTHSVIEDSEPKQPKETSKIDLAALMSENKELHSLMQWTMKTQDVAIDLDSNVRSARSRSKAPTQASPTTISVSEIASREINASTSRSASASQKITEASTPKRSKDTPSSEKAVVPSVSINSDIVILRIPTLSSITAEFEAARQGLPTEQDKKESAKKGKKTAPSTTKVKATLVAPSDLPRNNSAQDEKENTGTSPATEQPRVPTPRARKVKSGSSTEVAPAPDTESGLTANGEIEIAVDSETRPKPLDSVEDSSVHTSDSIDTPVTEKEDIGKTRKKGKRQSNRTTQRNDPASNEAEPDKTSDSTELPVSSSEVCVKDTSAIKEVSEKPQDITSRARRSNDSRTPSEVKETPPKCDSDSTAPASNNAATRPRRIGPKKPNTNKPKFKVGDEVRAPAEFNKYFDAVILEVREHKKLQDVFEHFVHFHGYSKRFDIWTEESLLRPEDDAGP